MEYEEVMMAKLTPLKAIRAKCRDCTCNQNVEIRECPITDCPLYEYRMGHRPKNDDVGEDFFEEEIEVEEIMSEDIEIEN